MYEKLEECPSCKHSQFHNDRIVTDYLVSKESFALTKCKKCQLVFTNPRPDQSHIHKYYETEDYISHSNKSTNPVNFIYKLVRQQTIKDKVNLINSYHKWGRLLDLGCGTGHFLASARRSGWDTMGVEVDDSARSQAIEKTQSTILSSLAALPEKEKFHIITAWHVIEHVHELRDTIKRLKKALFKDGILIVAIPNMNSFDAKIYEDYWAGYDVPRHLYHFTKQSFTYLATKNRLKLLDTRPMKYDAYYVSLLSEKYKGNSFPYPAAIRNGLKSNLEASKTGNYSSLIYVLQK